MQAMSMDDRRDFQWRQGWVSLGLPPAPLVAVSGIIAFFLYVSWHADYEEQVRRRAAAGFRIFLVLLLVALVVLARHAFLDDDGRLVMPLPWPDQDALGRAGTSPWGVAAVLALLLVMASHKSSFQMFRPPFH